MVMKMIKNRINPKTGVSLRTEQYAALGSTRGIRLYRTVTDRLLGLQSHTMGNLEQGTEHFEDALAFRRKAGFRPELAWTC